jgi:dTDP-glucose 4,6-dehydratase
VRKLLVTGGAGFIGANFVHYWLKAHPGERLVVLDSLAYSGNLSNLDSAVARSEFRFVRGSIGDTALIETLLREETIDTIVHFAAESHVDRSIAGPDAFIDTNVVGTHSLLKAARKCWLDERIVASHRFHHISTDEVYGSLGALDAGFNESTRYSPSSPYSASKAAADHLVRAYHCTYGLSVTTSNCSNNYGPYHLPEKLIPLVVVHILLGKPLPVYGDGKHVRDWLHVTDHCRGINLVINKGKSGEVYNIGGGAEVENIWLVKKLCELIDATFAADPTLKERFPNSPLAGGKSAASLITYVKDRPGHDRRYAIDCAKIENQLGYRAQVKLDQGLKQTVEWYLANEPWWRAVMDGSYARVAL